MDDLTAGKEVNSITLLYPGTWAGSQKHLNCYGLTCTRNKYGDPLVTAGRL